MSTSIDTCMEDCSYSMNLLEHYLVKVHSIEPCKEDQVNGKGFDSKDFVWVTATFECQGHKHTTTHLYSKKRWEKIVETEYFLG